MQTSKNGKFMKLIKHFLSMFDTKTCKEHGCGYQQVNKWDDKCAICRLHMR